MPQDIDALAAALGGQAVTPDVDALAAQFGGQAAEPPPMATSHGTEADATFGQQLARRMRAREQAFEQGPGGIDLQRLQRALPSLLASGVAISGGLGVIPAAIISGGMRYLGNRLQGQSREEAAAAGLTEGGTGLAIGGALKVPGAIGQLGRRAVKGALKADRGYLQNMATARQQGLMGAEDEIVDTALQERINPITRSGADRLQRAVDDTANARRMKIQAAPDRPVAKSGASTVQTLNRRLATETHATDASGTTGTRQVMRELSANPRYGANDRGELPDLTPRELARRVEADNARLRNLFGKEQAPGVEAIKDVRGLNARMLDRAAGTREESQRLKRLIDLRNVANIARRRGEARDVVGISDVVSLSAGRPEVLGATTAMRPAVQMRIGMLLDAIKRGVPLTGSPDEREAVKAALATLMASHGQE